MSWASGRNYQRVLNMRRAVDLFIAADKAGTPREYREPRTYHEHKAVLWYLAQRDHACPYCKAAKLDQCITKTGKLVMGVHNDRWKVARAAYVEAYALAHPDARDKDLARLRRMKY